jgi:hypothetical protein
MPALAVERPNGISVGRPPEQAMFQAIIPRAAAPVP